MNKCEHGVNTDRLICTQCRSEKNDNKPALSDGVINEAIGLLKAVYDVKIYQKKPSVASQGQCLDGFSALANFNGLADKIEKFLDDNDL